jgi:Uma2 family endonuclease
MVATRRLTIEDFAAMPIEGRWELIDRVPVEMTPSADESSSIAATILGYLWSHVRRHHLGRMYGAEGGFVLFPDRPTVRVPDVAFVRAERAPRGEERKSFPRLAPDLVVEVLSPSDSASEVVAKLEM